MPEPSGIARFGGEVCPGVHRFTLHDDRIDYQSDGYLLVERGKVILLDPLPMNESELRQHGAVEAIVLSASCHERSAWRYRKVFKVPVHAPEFAVDFEEVPDRWYQAGDLLPGGVRAMHAPGPTEAHYALYMERQGGIVFCADLLTNAASQGLAFVPSEYQDEPARTRNSVRQLLDLNFEILCSNHGDPITHEAKARVREALKRDKAGRNI